jgi:hypothetical protein
LRHYGLGLDLPSTNPAPIPFQENVQDLQRLKHFLDHEARDILTQCGAKDNPSFINYVSRERYLDALHYIGWGCAEYAFRDARPLAESARANHTEELVFQQLLDQAEAAMHLQDRIWQNFLGPANEVDAEVLYALHYKQEYERDQVYNTAVKLFQRYRNNGSQEPDGVATLGLTNVFLNLLQVTPDAHAWLQIVHQYPWARGTCKQPDRATLAREVGGKLDWAISLASAVESPDSRDYINTPYGDLAKNLAGSFAYYRQNGFWPGMLAIEANVDWLQAYYENFTRTALPSQEEAAFLVAVYENHTRTLFTQDLLLGLHQQLAGPRWNDQAGLYSLSLPALRSPFRALACGPEEFKYQATLSDRTGNETHSWENNGASAVYFQSNHIAAGNLLVKVSDAAGNEVDRLIYSPNNVQRRHVGDGAPGTWRVDFSFTHVTGSLNFTFFPATSGT